MNDLAGLSAFCKLKPLYLDFLNDCSIKSIDNIEKVVSELETKDLNILLQYILLPFKAQLCLGKLPEKETIRCIGFLTHVFKNSKLTEWNIFCDFFDLLTFEISKGPKEPNNVINGKEELKLSVCESIVSLVSNANEEIIIKMYSITFRPILGHAFYLFNLMLSREKSKPLLRAVLSAIGALTYSERVVGKKFEVAEAVASEALASCLPGLCTALHKVACGDIKQGHGIFVLALNMFSDLVVLVVGDESYKKCVANKNAVKVYKFSDRNDEMDELLDEETMKSISVVKDDSWFKTTSQNLEILINNLTILASHEHWKVRLAFIQFVENLLLKCTKSLETCIPIILPSVFGLSVDDNEEIVLYCKKLLTSFSEKFQNMNSASLNLIIEVNIDKLISLLMKCKISANDEKKLAALKSLLGYIEILGSSLHSLLFSMIRVERIILTMITLLEFDTSTLNLVEEIPALENFDLSNQPWPKKRFKFFDNEEILNIICKICYSLRHVQDSRLIVDYLMDKLLSSDLNTLQCIFLIGSIIQNCSHEVDAAEKYLDLVNDIQEFVLSNSLFDLPIQNEDTLQLMKEKEIPTTNIAISNNAFNKNKLQICLLLETISKCSMCLGTEFKLHLINILCPVMLKAGSSHFIISQCGCLCLFCIAQSCKYNSANELIKDNADYLTNVLIINFHQYFYKPEIIVVLRVAMQQCDSEALQLFKDLIFQILNILDYNQDKAYLFMVVLYSVVASIKKWFPSCKDNLVCQTVSKATSQQTLRVAILNYMSLKKKATCYVDEDVTEQDDEIVEELTNHNSTFQNTKSKTPLHVNITCEIFRRCVHLQSFENVYLRMLVLETVELCIIVLQNYENQLLPLVHEFWSPFLNRFTEENFVLKAFHLLLKIANECGNFIRQRTCKEVVPKLVYFLKKEYSKSRIKCNFRQYQWTNDHSLQILVLSEIGHLCTKLDIDDTDINTIVNVCLPYLRKEQPKVLQDAAVKSLKALATLDSDAVWFYWNLCYSESKVLIPPHECLSEVNFHSSDNSLTTVNIDF